MKVLCLFVFTTHRIALKTIIAHSYEYTIAKQKECPLPCHSVKIRVNEVPPNREEASLPERRGTLGTRTRVIFIVFFFILVGTGTREDSSLLAGPFDLHDGESKVRKPRVKKEDY